jgi:hypothetical protein
MRLPALRRWHLLLGMAVVGLAAWWALIEALLWLAGAVTGGTR